MNEVKYQITQFIFLVLLGLGAYWALTNLDTGVTYSRDEVVEDIQDTNMANPDQVVNAVNNNVTVVTSDTDNRPVVIPDAVVVETPTDSTSSQIELVSELQELIDDNITMDSGASGVRVGVVQQFLRVYHEDTTVSIDNDFGPTTKRLVREFQQSELSGGDGRVGPNTLRAMVSYLNNQ